MKIKRNDEGEYVPTEEKTDSSPGGKITSKIPEDGDIDKKIDEREYDKPPNDDNASEDKDEEKADYRPDTGVDDKSTESGGPDKEPIEGVDVKTHGGEYASKQVPESAHQNNQITLTTEVARHDHLQQLTPVQEDRAAEAVNHVHHWDKQEMQSGTTEQKDNMSERQLLKEFLML